MPSTHNQNISRWLLAATALSYGFQLVWFGSLCIHQIDIDGIDYIGIARHLRSHQFYSAINDFRSPLLSWMIAAGSFFDGDLVLVGKVLNIGSYLLCGALLYIFYVGRCCTSSRKASGIRNWLLLWRCCGFSLSRGLSVVAVGMVTPDFLFAALTLAYFIVLLQCLRTDEKRWWGLLGGIHALAFLAKGFALPWLALSTIFSVLLSRPRNQTTDTEKDPVLLEGPAIRRAASTTTLLRFHILNLRNLYRSLNSPSQCVFITQSCDRRHRQPTRPMRQYL